MTKLLTEQQQHEIVEAYKAGLTLTEIGRRFDRSPTGVMHVLDKHNVPRRRRGAPKTKASE